MTSRPMLRRHLVGALRELGWAGVDVEADVRAFQQGYALGAALVVDGQPGPATREALRKSLREHRGGRPDASTSFRWAEFRCRCGGAFTGCRVILVHRELLRALEAYRAAVGGPVDVVSGYRCPGRNRAVGGAPSSQHLHGTAADVQAVLPLRRVQQLGRFSGLGRQKRSGRVRHVDVRHVRVPGATPSRPTVWDYPT